VENAFTLLAAGFIFLAPPVLVLLSRKVHGWQKVFWALGTAVPILVSAAGALLGFVTNPHGDPVLLFALLPGRSIVCFVAVFQTGVPLAQTQRGHRKVLPITHSGGLTFSWCGRAWSGVPSFAVVRARRTARR